MTATSRLLILYATAGAGHRRAAEAVAGATLAETETLLDRKAAEMIEKTVDEANRRFDDEIDRRLSGLLKVSLLD